MTAAVLLIAIPTPGSVVATSRPAMSGPPAEYADLYTMLAGRLRTIDATLGHRRGGITHDVIWSAELLAANGNQGETLLRAQTWPVVLMNLDALQALGVRGVKVAVKYPLLVPAFPRSTEYLRFYKRLSVELKRRNLKFLAQMTATFREPVFSQVPVAPFYAGMTDERYRREKRQQAEIIIREMAPDYLTLENEPQTQAQNLGLPVTVQSFVELIQHVLGGLDRRGVLVGAGVGTWDDLAYVHGLARTGIDYIDLHIYPITGDFVVDRAFHMAEVADRAGKRLVIGEAWLYKARERELGGPVVASAPALFARDVFSFWEPLDVAFIGMIGTLSHHLRSDFTSFFWSRHFFGYIEYDEHTRRLPPAELFSRANRAAAQGMMATPPQPTRAGVAFQGLTK
jgi:hypothetical protein